MKELASQSVVEKMEEINDSIKGFWLPSRKFQRRVCKLFLSLDQDCVHNPKEYGGSPQHRVCWRHTRWLVDQCNLATFSVKLLSKRKRPWVKQSILKLKNWKYLLTFGSLYLHFNVAIPVCINYLFLSCYNVLMITIVNATFISLVSIVLSTINFRTIF